MNTVDIILLVPMIYAAWRGFRKGLIIEIFTLLALLVGIYAGIHFSDWTAGKIAENFEIEPNYLPVVAFTFTFLAVGAMVYFAGKMLEQMVRFVNLSPLNKIMGSFFGLIKMIYTLSVILILIETYDERGNFIPDSLKEEAMFYYPIKKTASATIPAIESSTIWLKNVMENNLLEDFTFEDLKSLKEEADSLGLDINDLREFKENLPPKNDE